MPVYNPERDYPPHEQDNPYFVQQYGYLERPHPNTTRLIGLAVEKEALATSKMLAVIGRRPFNAKNYKKSRPVVTLFNNGKTVNTTIQRQKCGPSYFPS